MDEVQLFQDAFFYWRLYKGTEAVWSIAATANWQQTTAGLRNTFPHT